MRLIDIVKNLDKLEDDLTIYVREDPPTSCLVEAVVVNQSAHGQKPGAAVGFHYLLEVSVAKEVIQVWIDWSGDPEPSAQEKCEAILYYGANDAYLPVV